MKRMRARGRKAPGDPALALPLDGDVGDVGAPRPEARGVPGEPPSEWLYGPCAECGGLGSVFGGLLPLGAGEPVPRPKRCDVCKGKRWTKQRVHLNDLEEVYAVDDDAPKGTSL